MRLALCTTTIHVPHALKLLRKCSSDVRFFVAFDKKSIFPTKEDVLNLEDCEWLYPSTQGGKWKCSELLGWNTIARRNIAFLEALKWGADVIYSWDDDNIPVSIAHFDLIEAAFDSFNGLKVGERPWFDPGWLLVPPTRHRGFPRDQINRCMARSGVDAKVGVAAGLVLGDSDIDATTRMEKAPDIGQVHLMGTFGVVVDLNTWTVFNSQNTAIIRDLVPAFFLMPNVGRHDDIFASLIVQRVGRERGYHVHFGQPFTYQQRNAHDLLDDLRAEIGGMENTIKLADLLDSIVLKGRSTIEDTRIIYQTLLHCEFLPRASVEAGLAFLEDCEGILK